MDTYPKSRARHSIAWIVTIILLATRCVAYPEEIPGWASSLTSDKGPGNFTAPPPMRLAYRFGILFLVSAGQCRQYFILRGASFCHQNGF